MPARVLITGITGFAGSHLAERLVASGWTVHGLALEDGAHRHLRSVADRVVVHRADVTSSGAVAGALDAAAPDAVVHLAGQAVPTLAARDPVAAVRANVLGTAAVCAALEARPRVRLVIASSAEVYGQADGEALDEDAPLRPLNAYAATKVAAEALARDLGERGERCVVILRPTNQIGPRQHPGLVASAFAKQIAEAEAGLAAPVVRHGSLEAARDFVDVRDMADAYERAAALDRPGVHVFNVGTGRAVAVGEILSTLVELARVSVRAELDPERVRPGAATAVALDASRFRAATGWTPRTPLRTSLGDLLDHWRAEVRERSASPR